MNRKLSAILCLLYFSLLTSQLVAATAPLEAGQLQKTHNYSITKIRFFPRAGHAADMKGGRFVGSLTSAMKGFEDLVDITQSPAEGQWTEIVIPADRIRTFRYVKYHARNDVWADIAELEFYAGDRLLTGLSFGTTGSGQPENDPTLAFDRDTSTFFRGISGHNQYVGLDLGVDSQVSQPTVSVKQGIYITPQAIALSCATPDARILYSIDGNGRPGVDAQGHVRSGTFEYKGSPIRINKSSIVQAIAIKPGLATSTTAISAYHIGKIVAQSEEHATFHIGNSLTDTVNGWMELLAASAGHKVRYYRFTIPGAPTDWLWDHPGTGFGENNYAQAFLARAPLTDLVTQPFFGHGRSVDNEADYSGRFFDLARQYSPNIQMWLYVQWTDTKWDRDNWANGRTQFNNKELVFGNPAVTWQDAVANHVKYTELVMHEMNKARAHEIKTGTCKPVRIIPGGMALAELKTRIANGQVPGLTNFEAVVFAGPGDIHLSSRGAYLISLVHYACIYGQNPEDKVTAANAQLTPEQARIFQQIAWNAAKIYQYSGLASDNQ
jgi:chitobiase/beta-hexosaminidase-like protein